MTGVQTCALPIYTFGHAIETGLGYGKWLHGEAVGCGMVMAAQLSLALGLVSNTLVDRLTALIQRAGLPVRAPHLTNVQDDSSANNADAYLRLMRMDKKSDAGNIKFIVINDAGRATMQGAPDSLVRDVIDRCCSRGKIGV